jgi:hypothetical protein
MGQGCRREKDSQECKRKCVDLAGNGVHIWGMSFDISALLDQWDYQPGQVVVRRCQGKDGIEKIQLRVDLGLLQMNAKGRPDGKRPFGRESLLEYYMDQLDKFKREHGNDDKEFRLTADDCGRLQQEFIQYHHRYICLFQLEDYDAVIEDTDRNLKVFAFVEKYAASEELAWSLQQFRPQCLMMRIRARGATALKTNRYDQVAEQSGEIQSLEMWLQEIQHKRPLTAREKLESALDEAVKNEDYEKAAQVRDELRKMG